MEESLSLRLLQREFLLKEVDIRTYSPLTLAFIGDCVYDLVIRTVITAHGNRDVNSLHKMKSGLVKAASQARMAEALQDFFSEQEMAVYKRGRNATTHSSAKNASVADYRKATGLEALFGYLYLDGQEERMVFLMKAALEKLDMQV